MNHKCRKTNLTGPYFWRYAVQQVSFNQHFCRNKTQPVPLEALGEGGGGGSPAWLHSWHRGNCVLPQVCIPQGLGTGPIGAICVWRPGFVGLGVAELLGTNCVSLSTDAKVFTHQQTVTLASVLE